MNLSEGAHRTRIEHFIQLAVHASNDCYSSQRLDRLVNLLNPLDSLSNRLHRRKLVVVECAFQCGDSRGKIKRHTH